MPYALLQSSLEQAINLEDLEEVIGVATTITRADCLVIQREAFGIIIQNLEREESLALQAALKARNVPTEVVDEADLPVLPTPRHGCGVKLSENAITVVDMYGREELVTLDRVVFVAAGHVRHLKNVPFQQMEIVDTYGPRGSVDRHAEMVTEHRLDKVPEFRLELFCLGETPRLQWLLSQDNLLSIDGNNLRLRDKNQLDALSLSLGNLLPPDQVNLGIKKVGAGEDLDYPSVHAFEKEIVWSLYRMAHEPS